MQLFFLHSNQNIQFIFKQLHIQTLLKLHKIGFSKGVYLENKQSGLSQTTFLNAILIGCGCQDFMWVEEVIEKYGKFLHSSNREETLKYGKIVLYYTKGDALNDSTSFYKVIELYQKVQNVSKQFEISLRSILVRVYYEIIDKQKDIG